jgi:hypothetical protein
MPYVPCYGTSFVPYHIAVALVASNLSDFEENHTDSMFFNQMFFENHTVVG